MLEVKQGQSPAGKNMSKEAEDIIVIRQQATADDVMAD
jgi:hypothetical protein